MYSVCILIYVSMYLYSYPFTQGIAGLAAGGAWELFEVRLTMTIEWTQRYTPRPWSSELGDALGGRDRVNSEMHLEAMIERVWWCTWRPRWSHLRDELGGHDRASLEMHLEAVIEWTERCTWRPWSSEFGDALAGYDRARLKEYVGVVDLEVVDWRCTSCWDSIHWLVNLQLRECDEVTEW